MRDIQIIYFSRSFFPSRAANSIHLMKMTRAISKLYSKVTLVGFKSKTIDISEEEVFEKYDVEPTFTLKLIKTPRRGIAVYYILYVFFSLLFRPRKNIIIYSREINISYLSILLGFNVILESHDFFRTRIKRYIEPTTLKSEKLLKLVVISAALKKDYLDNYHLLSKIEVHPDAADIVCETKHTETPWPGRREVLQIGYFGHLYEGRGIEIIIDAAKRLDEFDFHVIGGNDPDIKKYKNMGLPDNITFHGFVEQKGLPGLRSRCDILLLPYQEKVGIYNSDSDTARWMSPMKLFEYMSSNKAIVSSDLPVLREVLNRENSILVKSNAVAEWEKAIVSLKDKIFRERIGQKAYDDFNKKYTWDKRAQNIFYDL